MGAGSVRWLAVVLAACSALACGGGRERVDAGGARPADVGSATVARILTRDGIELRTWIRLPAPLPEGGVPVVLWRTPYRVSGGWSDAGNAEFARFLNERGYGLVLQDVRGRPDSGGTFAVLRHEIEDGQDTTRWIVRQPWSDGRIATMGGSYDGFTALAAAVDNPDVKLVISDDGTTDERCERIGGTFAAHTLSWLHLVETGAWISGEEARALTNALDPRALDVALLGHAAPYWREALAQDGPGLWPADGSLEPRWPDLCVPTLHVYSQASGWNDPLDIWRGMRAHGCPARAAEQYLVVTPDPHAHHLSVLGTTATPVNELMLRLLDAHLGERPVDTASIPRVQWVQHGESELRPLADWPPATRAHALHLVSGLSRADGALAPAPSGPASTALRLDPATLDPCDEDYPTLWFTSTPLAEPLIVAGCARVELCFEADVPDTDLVVTLYDRNAGRAGEPDLQTGWGALRARWRAGHPAQPLEPGALVRVSIPLTAIAHEFRAGNALALSLAPGRCGLLENPLTGEPVGAQTHRRAGTLRVWHDDARPSRLVLPVRE